MNAKEWHAKHGPQAARDLCEKLEISIHYWKGVMHRGAREGADKGISHQQALRFAVASDELTGDPMTVLALLGLRDVPARLIGKLRSDK
jgi:hypothetical protein